MTSPANMLPQFHHFAGTEVSSRFVDLWVRAANGLVAEFGVGARSRPGPSSRSDPRERRPLTRSTTHRSLPSSIDHFAWLIDGA